MELKPIALSVLSAFVSLAVAMSSQADTYTHRIRVEVPVAQLPSVSTWTASGRGYVSVTPGAANDCCTVCDTVVVTMNYTTNACDSNEGGCQTCISVCPCPGGSVGRFLFDTPSSTPASVNAYTSGGSAIVVVTAPSSNCWRCSDIANTLNSTTNGCDGDDGSCYSCTSTSSNCPS